MIRLIIFMLSGMLFLVLGGVVNAQSRMERTVIWVHSNLIDDYCSCVAFYTNAAIILEESDKQSAQKFDRHIESLGKRIISLGEKSGFKEAVLNAKLELAYKDINKEMGNDQKNFSIILNKYGTFCLDVVERPENRMKYWSDKAIKENR